MASNYKTSTSDAVKELIVKKAEYDVKKQEIYKEAKALESELKTLSEGYKGFSGSFGFKSPDDASETTGSKTGFVNDPVFSRLNSLGAEITAELRKQEAADAEAGKSEAEKLNESTMAEIKKLKAEIEKLKKK